MWLGQGVDFSRLPSANSAVAWSVNTIRIDTRTAIRYVAAGKGVARIRFSIPSSRRATSVSASPAKAVFAAP